MQNKHRVSRDLLQLSTVQPLSGSVKRQRLPRQVRCAKVIFVVLESNMLSCSDKPDFVNISRVSLGRPTGRDRLTRIAKGFCKSTEDLCKTTSLYRMWDQRQMIKNWRHAAWALLRDHHVLCAVWLHEVLAFHGADCALDDYHLVVHNPQIAATILSLYGYRSIAWNDSEGILADLQCQRIRLSAPGAKVSVVLLSASEWCYDLSRDALHDELCPYLPEFIDAMIELWLRIPVRSHFAYTNFMHLLEIIIHESYMLYDFGERVCENNYALWLQPHHREVHFDIVARSMGLVKGNLDFRSRHKHHVHKANLIKQGRFDPQPRRARPYGPRLPILFETAEDTKSTMEHARQSFIFSAAAMGILPEYREIGIAL